MLHLALCCSAADAEPLRDLVVAELGGGAQQEHLPTARLEVEQRALHDLDALLERDDSIGRGQVRGKVRELLVVAVRTAGAPLPETVVREIGRDLEDESAHASDFDVLDLHETEISLLHQVLGLVAPREQVRQVAEQRGAEALEGSRDELVPPLD